MTELLLFFMRFFSDYFWEYKNITLISSALAFLFFIFLFFKVVRLRSGLYVYPIELTVFALVIFTIGNILFYFEQNVLVIGGKIIAGLMMYFIGCWLKIINTSSVWKLYIPIYFLIIISFLTGSGFQMWGAYTTFSGGYYFKTDLALAVTIFSVFVLVSNLSFYVKFFLVIFNFILVFYSNARIYYLIYPLVCFCYVFLDFILINSKNTLKMFFSFLIFSFLSFQALFFLMTNVFTESNMLFFNLSEGFSEANTQGRSVIWGNLLEQYSNSGLVKQLFGAGLTADVRYSEKLNFLHGLNAHNTFLYLLVSIGAFGLLIFFYFLYQTFKRFVYLSTNKELNRVQKLNLYCFLSFSLIFLISSLTNVTMIFQQLSWFYFFYCGLLNNKTVFRN